MDALESGDDQKKFEEHKKAHEKGTEAKGHYGMSKAKANSVGLRRVQRRLRDEKRSIVIVISQTRDNTGAGPYAPAKTHSGGKALTFYSTCKIWTAKGATIKKKVRAKDRKIGNYVQIKIEKNRLTGKLHEVQTAIYPEYGIDDTGSMIDFLVSEKWWPRRGGKIVAEVVGGLYKRDALVRLCDEPEGRRKLLKSLQACWARIEQEKTLGRKPRYS